MSLSSLTRATHTLPCLGGRLLPLPSCPCHCRSINCLDYLRQWIISIPTWTLADKKGQSKTGQACPVPPDLHILIKHGNLLCPIADCGLSNHQCVNQHSAWGPNPHRGGGHQRTREMLHWTLAPFQPHLGQARPLHQIHLPGLKQPLHEGRVSANTTGGSTGNVLEETEPEGLPQP